MSSDIGEEKIDGGRLVATSGVATAALSDKLWGGGRSFASPPNQPYIKR